LSRPFDRFVGGTPNMTEVCGIVATNRCQCDSYVTFMDDFQPLRYPAVGRNA
jgi:hypothetical protein